MITTLEKIKRLEEYIAINHSAIDPVVEITINKLLSREFHRLSDLRSRLMNQLAEFEKCYNFSSNDFYRRYESGELDDSMDFVEWAASVEMIANINKQIALLDTAAYQ